MHSPHAVHFPTEASVPETRLHFELRTALFFILKREIAARATLGSDQFVYWNAKEPRECLAPDLFVKLGKADERFDSWKTWERGAPELALEILSAHEAWEEKLARYQALGVSELVSFDPSDGGLRVWDRREGTLVERVARAVTPCVPLDMFWVVAPLGGTRCVRLARDAAGRVLLPTPEERIAELESK